MKESRVQDIARVALSRDVLLFRNNVGVAEHWDGTRPQRVQYGLAPGSADLIGVCAGRFVAVEIKAHNGRVSPVQTAWMDLVRRNGGFATVLRGPKDDDDEAAVVRECRALVERCRAGASE